MIVQDQLDGNIRFIKIVLWHDSKFIFSSLIIIIGLMKIIKQVELHNKHRFYIFFILFTFTYAFTALQTLHVIFYLKFIAPI